MQTKVKRYIKDYSGIGEVIVLLHGFISSSGYWSKLIPYLQNDSYRIITIDLLGFGKAPKPSDINYDYKDQFDHINSALESLNITKPFVIIGHSMGALIADKYSIIYPKKVSSLILLNPPLYESAKEARTVLRKTSRIYRFLLDSRFRKFAWSALHIVSLNNISKHTNISRERSLKNIIEKSTILNDLTHTNTKTMLLVGRKDRKEYQKNLAKTRFSNSVKLYLENTTHHSPRQNTDLVKTLILNFLNKDNHKLD
jgi:pimeloyl-ACP methyl ester carboxylesterase